jgi:GT2 family glycosyltransferase
MNLNIDRRSLVFIHPIKNMVNKKIFTIIPNWNLRDDLGECLDSLVKQAGIVQEVIVVDNGSQDGSVEYVRKNYPEIHVIALKENIGYAGALNVGIKYALEKGAVYIYLLNNDTVVPDDVLYKLFSVIERNQDIGIVAPKILYNNNRKIVFALGDKRSSLFPVPIGYGYRKKDRPKYSGEMDFDYVTGCAMLISAEVFRKTGLFDEVWFMYYEDADFCYRVRQAGFRIVCYGDAVVYHKASLSANKNYANSTRIRARNRVWFYRRYPHGLHPWLTNFILIMVAVYRSVWFLLHGQRALIRPYVSGLIEGWKNAVPEPAYSHPNYNQL